MNNFISKKFINEKAKNEIQIENKDFILLRNIRELIPTVSSAPTYTPSKFSEQFRIYTNGATLRLYIYDTTNAAWRYVALT